MGANLPISMGEVQQQVRRRRDCFPERVTRVNKLLIGQSRVARHKRDVIYQYKARAGKKAVISFACPKQ